VRVILPRLLVDVPKVVEAAALLPPPPVKVTLGAEVYPAPAPPSERLFTEPADAKAVDRDPLKLAPLMVTEGADVYPLPPFVRLTALRVNRV
tara:strand:- start:985 stop:1260 length:276 start_codon:yes stop_codon:yes gene_type:complete